MSDPTQQSGALDAFKISAMNSAGSGGGGGNYWMKDQQMGAGLSLNNLAPAKGNVPVSFFQDKGTGFKDKLSSGFGLRTRVQFSGELMNLMEGVDGSSGDGGGNATYDQVYGAGQTIYQNGAVHMGHSPESMLGAMEPPHTPGMGKSQERGRDDGFGLG